VLAVKMGSRDKVPYCTKDSNAELATSIEEGALLSTYQHYYYVQIQILACHVSLLTLLFALFLIRSHPVCDVH